MEGVAAVELTITKARRRKVRNDFKFMVLYLVIFTEIR
jgi:hypothetical protein